REQALEPPTDLPAAAHVARGGGDDHTPVDEVAQLVDLLGIVAAVGHGDDRHRRARLLDPRADRAGRTGAVAVEHRDHTRFALGVLLQVGHGRVAGVVVDHEDLAREVHALEDAVETRHDRLALVVHRDDDRHAQRVAHTRTPSPRRFQMSTTGTSIAMSAYTLCGAPITSRSARRSVSSSGARSGSTFTYGSVHTTSP